MFSNVRLVAWLEKSIQRRGRLILASLRSSLVGLEISRLV